ncbi:MAG: hypothetical protein M3R52_06285, partial [Acidobacteriota bacterium]|nr:hypothetical protein [Acidobacteriota bacterium]
MKIPEKTIRTLSLSAMLLVVSSVTYSQTNVDPVKAAIVPERPSGIPTRVRLKLVDGSDISVDEAWESEQGIWYRRGGMSHLVTRDRIKAIERVPASQPNADLQIAKVVITSDPETGSDGPNSSADNSSGDRPVWIYLVGGARVEADNAIESAAGVWYRR